MQNIKELIGIEKFADSKILIEIDDELQDYITLKNILTLMRSVFKDYDKLYREIMLKEAPLVA